jgi:methionyl-tRNA formyltransferase
VPPPLAQVATELGLPLFQPERINRSESLIRLERENPDLLIVISYGQILKLPLLNLPRLGAVNLHGSLLPKYRGASPVQAAILNGEQTTGVTSMLMDEGLDSGPILLTATTEISEGETAPQLHDRLAELGAPLLLETVRRLLKGSVTGRPQDASLSSSCGLIRKEDGIVNWSASAQEIERRIRAFTPWPGAVCEFPVRTGRVKAQLLEGKVLATENGAPGTVLAADATNLMIACGTGALRIQRLKPASKKEMTASEFLRGNPLKVGSVLDAPL